MMSWPMVFVMGWFKKIRFTRNNDELRGWCINHWGFDVKQGSLKDLDIGKSPCFVLL
jgi:hypothetical protein